jgi:hypothetical protein
MEVEKMNFEIVPYVGIGCIKFGMKREEVRKCFDNQYEEFKKTPFSETLTDDFGGCHVFYKKQDTCEAIECFEESNVMMDGKKIIGMPYAEIKAMFEEIDNSLEFNDAGFTSFKYGTGVYAPFAQDRPSEPVESVIVFEKGYYE